MAVDVTIFMILFVLSFVYGRKSLTHGVMRGDRRRAGGSGNGSKVST